MDILMSIHKVWIEKIFNKEKILEFRKSIGKNFKIGDTVYLYETSKNGGSKKVVGEFTIKDIVKLNKKSKIATYDLLPYYCLNIIKDEEAFEAVDKIFNIPLKNYNDAIKLSYIFNPHFIEYLRDTNNFPDLSKFSRDELNIYLKNQEKSSKLVKDCDNWLFNIGFYNEYWECYYKYYLEIDNVKKYDIPLDLSNFKNQKGEIILKASQSWCYCEKC